MAGGPCKGAAPFQTLPCLCSAVSYTALLRPVLHLDGAAQEKSLY